MSDLPYVLEGRYTQGHPLDVEDARKAARSLAEMRRNVRSRLEAVVNKDLPDARREAASKEKTYREAKSTAYVTVAAEGIKLAGERDAKVDSITAQARFDRDIADALVEHQKQRIRLLEKELEEVDGDRASFHKLAEWSMRVDAFAQEQRQQQPAREFG